MNAETKQLFQNTLKKNGYSVTMPRQYVFTLLWQQEPQTMNQLVRRAVSSIDRASLYRTIELFEKLDIAKKIYIGWKYKVELSEKFSHHHHHMTCVSCGVVVSFEEDQEIEQHIKMLGDKYGFFMKDHQLEVQGLCQKCS